MAGKILRLWAPVFMLALLTTGLAWAKGAPTKVTVSGPGLASEGYLITRYVMQADKKLSAWDRVTYYPGAEGEIGTVFLEGMIGPSASEFDGRWYLASFEGQAAMRQILSEHMTKLGPGAPQSNRFQAPRTGILALSLLAPLAVVGVALAARQVLWRG